MDTNQLITFAGLSQNTIESKLLSLDPGIASDGNVKSVLGNPAETFEKDDGTIIYTYKSNDPSRPNIIYSKNGTVTFVQVVFDTNISLTTNEVSQLYGIPEDKSYSSHANNALVYSYPSKGILFHINGDSLLVFMLQKFEPTSKTQFKETIGKDFSGQPLGDVFKGTPSPSNQSATGLQVQATVQPTGSPITLSNTVLYTGILVLCLAALAVTFLLLKKSNFFSKK